MLRIRHAFRLKKLLNRSSIPTANWWVQRFPIQTLRRAVHVMGPTLVALAFAGAANVAHAQGTISFSGAQTFMQTVQTFAEYAGAVICLPDPTTGTPPSGTDRMADLLEEIEIADQVGLDVFGMGEHHRAEFLDSAPAIILAAAAARTKTIRLTSAVTVLSAADPVRVFQEFATLDLISNERAEIVVGRGSFGEAYPLFGFDTRDYDALFAEKLDLFLKLRETTHLTWHGRFRPSLTGRVSSHVPISSACRFGLESGVHRSLSPAPARSAFL